MVGVVQGADRRDRGTEARRHRTATLRPLSKSCASAAARPARLKMKGCPVGWLGDVEAVMVMVFVVVGATNEPVGRISSTALNTVWPDDWNQADSKKT